MRPIGIYENVDINEYHSEEGLSNTGVSLVLDCPKRYWYEYQVKRQQVDDGDDKSLIIGKAVHMLLLEPEKFDENFYPMTSQVDLRTKIGKEAYEEAKYLAEGREIIRAEVWAEIFEISESAKSNTLWGALLSLPGKKVENSIYWDGGIYNTRLKTRPDLFNNEVIIDIKTTKSIPEFKNAAFRNGYHRQSAMQIDGVKASGEGTKQHGFFVIETRAPYLTALFTLDEASIELGRQEYLDAAATYSECMKCGQWPGYDEGQFELIKIPSWATKNGVM